jgi:hypothetical protein
MATRATQEARADEWVERAGRFGLGARGVVYCVLALLALALATGDRPEQTDHRGALQELAERGIGKALLVVLIAGFLAYAGWRLARAVRGEGGDEPNPAQRALDVGKAALYLGLAYSAVELLGGRESSGSEDEAQRAFTARLMTDHSWGRWAVGLVGGAVAAYGAWQVWRGLSQRFRDHLDETFGPTHEATVQLGVAGHAARGAVIVLIGWLVIRAAADFEPSQPVGVDAALREVLHAPYGRALAIGVALGLGAFGLYSFGEARYRQIS